jgi:integrase
LRDAAHVTLGDLRDLHARDYRLSGRRSGTRRAQLWRRILEHFGEREPAVRVTFARVDAYLAARVAEGAARGTAQQEVAALRRGFTLARRAELLRPDEGPAHWPAPRVQNTRSGFFEKDDLERVLAHLPPDLADLVTFLYLTGWRRGEAVALAWSQVDRKARVLRIETTKSGEPRTRRTARSPSLPTC